MNEQFVDIEGYEGDYQISNYGNVRSLKKAPFLILKPMVATNGYLVACLWKNNIQRKHCIHRLVANAFLPNPENLDEVNHIDEDKTNNRVDNLEWCTHKYNMNYGAVREKIGRANTGKTISAERRKQIAIDTSHRRWVHDTKNEKFVYLEEIKLYENLGWQKGRLPRKKKRSA